MIRKISISVFCPEAKKKIDVKKCFTCINFDGKYQDHIDCIHGYGYFDRSLLRLIHAGRWEELPDQCNKYNSVICWKCDKFGTIRCYAAEKKNRDRLIKGAGIK